LTITKKIKAFINKNIVDWVDYTVAHECRMEARYNGLPEHLVEGIVTKKDGYMGAVVKNTYKIKGKKKNVPIGRLVNDGWGKGGYDIFGKPVLRWVDMSGNVHFATKVHHPGFKGYHFMESGKIKGLKKFRKYTKEQMQNRMEWIS